MNTPNKHFNESWEFLAAYHETANLPAGESLYVSAMPKVKNKEWKFYFKALSDVFVIGKRNSWLTIHVDGNGFPAYLYVKPILIMEDTMILQEIVLENGDTVIMSSFFEDGKKFYVRVLPEKKGNPKNILNTDDEEKAYRRFYELSVCK